MKGTLKKCLPAEWNAWYPSLYPKLEEWLSLWTEDTVRAIEMFSIVMPKKDPCCCGDQSFLKMLREGIIDEEELETACVEWLEKIRNSDREGLDFENLYQQMFALSSVITGSGLVRCSGWFIDHFDEMRKFFPSRHKGYKAWRKEVIFLATYGIHPDYSDIRLKAIRPQMIKILESRELCTSDWLYSLHDDLEIMFRCGTSYKYRLEKIDNLPYFNERTFKKEFLVMWEFKCMNNRSLTDEDKKKAYQEQKEYLLKRDEDWRKENAAVRINIFEE